MALQEIRHLSETTREGSSLLGLSDAAEKMGFRSMGVQIDFNTLAEEVPFPCIVHWNKQHFVVVYDISPLTPKAGIFTKIIRKVFPFLPPLGERGQVRISDPSYGLITYTKEEFIKNWIGENADATTEEGIALLLETTPSFYNTAQTPSPSGRVGEG